MNRVYNCENSYQREICLIIEKMNEIIDAINNAPGGDISRDEFDAFKRKVETDYSNLYDMLMILQDDLAAVSQVAGTAASDATQALSDAADARYAADNASGVANDALTTAQTAKATGEANTASITALDDRVKLLEGPVVTFLERIDKDFGG